MRMSCRRSTSLRSPRYPRSPQSPRHLGGPPQLRSPRLPLPPPATPPLHPLPMPSTRKRCSRTSGATSSSSSSVARVVLQLRYSCCEGGFVEKSPAFIRKNRRSCPRERSRGRDRDWGRGRDRSCGRRRDRGRDRDRVCGRAYGRLPRRLRSPVVPCPWTIRLRESQEA